MNQSGGFVMRADKVGRDTVLAQIVQMVAQAQRSRAPIQRLADQVSGWFVPAVILAALLAFVAWSIWGPEPRFTYGLIAAVSVLIIACPCALGLATPMSIMVGVGRGAQSGVLIKNAEALERIEKVDTLVVDKTGTLTEGKPSVVGDQDRGWHRGSRPAAPDREPGAQQRASAGGGHRARRRTSADLSLAPVENFDSPVGKGVTGSVDGRKLVIGNRRIMTEAGIDTSGLDQSADELRRDGATAIFVAIDGKAAGIIAIADPDQGDDAGRDRRAQGGRHPRRHADRRQRDHGEGGGGRSSASPTSRPRSCRRTRARSSSGSGARAASSPWPATA